MTIILWGCISPCPCYMYYDRSAEDMHLEVAAMGGTTQAFSSRDLVMYNVEVHSEMK